MPHLVYFGRLWRFSGDELSIPSVCAATGRILWTILLGIIYAITGSYLSDCSSGWIIMLYLSLSIIVSLASILCEIFLARTSIKGTIVNQEPRKPIEFYLNIHLFLGICQFICAVFGICLLEIKSLPCSSEFRKDIVKALLLLTIISQIIDISGIVCCCTLFSSRSADLETYYQEPDLSSSRPSILTRRQEGDVKKWEERCRSVCRGLQYCTCNLFGGSGIAEDLDAVAAILSDFFHHEGFLDVVPSDVVAGILLVRFQQRISALKKRQQIADSLNNRSGILSPLHPSSRIRNDIRTHYSVDVENAITIVSLAIGDGLGAGYTLDRLNDTEDVVHIVLQNRKKYLTALEILHKYNIKVGLPTHLKSIHEEPLKIQLGTSSSLLSSPSPSSMSSYQNSVTQQEDLDLNDDVIENVTENCIVATDYIEMKEIAHFAPYALAAYSTLMFLYINPGCGLCELCHYSACISPMGSCNPCAKKSNNNQSTPLCCCACGSNGKENISGDNSCQLHEAAVRKMARLGECELIYANFSNEVTIKPYAVFVDYEKQCLIITVRGTLSLEDCITDAVAHPESLYETGKKWNFDGTDKFAHSGMLKAANWIREDLKRHPRVAELLSFVAGSNPPGGSIYKDGYIDNSSQNISTPLSQTVSVKNLRIVGHSLGAGTAAVLGILMKSEYPTLRVYGYGTPGSVLDKKTALEVSNYMTSCILGDDVVGSLSFHSLHDLRERVLDSIARSRVSKMHIMQTTMFQDINNLDHLLYPQGEEPDSSFKHMVETYRDHMRAKLESRSLHRLHHPGRIIHLRSIGSETKNRCIPLFSSKRRVFAPFVTNMNYFSEIHISPTMIFDHLPDHYVDHLNDLINDWDLERE